MEKCGFGFQIEIAVEIETGFSLQPTKCLYPINSVKPAIVLVSIPFLERFSLCQLSYYSISIWISISRR